MATTTPARPPTAPVPSVATSTPTPLATTPAVVATPTRPPVRGRRGRLTFSQQRLAEPLILEQDVLDPAWNKFKTYFGVCVGGICFMAWIVYLSFQFGVSRSVVPPPATVSPQPTVVYVPAPPVPSEPSVPATPAELSPEELDRRHSEYLRNWDR